MNARPIALIAAAMIVLVAPAAADKPWNPREFAAELASPIERFFLWNDCGPMRVDAFLRSDDSNFPEAGLLRHFSIDLFGLSRENVISAVRDRFEATHLVEDAGAATRLFVRARVNGNAVRVDVSYEKPVRDLISGAEFYTTTWESQSAGEHGRDDGLILSQVMKEVDKFIDEYLRMNRDSCGKK